MRVFARLIAVVCLGLSLASHSLAQNPFAQSGAQSLFIDPSVRSSAMGRSSNAVFWGEATNDWSNPALLAFRNGIQYEWGRTQLVPDLAKNVFFTTKRLTLGGWGAGILVAGRPVDGLGGSRLDYGESFATDPDGNVLGSFRSYEDTHTFAAGANILELTQHLFQAGGSHLPDFNRYGDVAVGWSEKRTHTFLAPSIPTPGSESQGEATTHDSGILARLTPYDGIDHAGLVPGLDRVLGARIDASYGGSTLNYNNARITYSDFGSDPIARIQIKGWAARAVLDMPRATRHQIRSGQNGWLIDLVAPLVSAGKTGSKEVPLIPDTVNGGLRSGTRIRNSGWEITLLNIYSFRGGKIDDPEGTVQGKTSGWGVGLRLRDLAGFSYDRATVPQAFGLARVHRKALRFYVNPIEVWSQFRSHPGEVASRPQDAPR
jgi:hypothetical protein